MSEEIKQKVIANCKNDAYKSFGKYTIERKEDIDGWKYFLPDGAWTMIRARGTEPVLRVYGQAKDRVAVIDLLETVKATLLN